MENDFINRQVAIDAFRDTVDLMPECYARDIIADLPSAQPDLQPVCNQLATDTISRQAAIDAINKPYDVSFCELPLGNRSYSDIAKCLMIAYDKGKEDAIKHIQDLPDAQPEETCDTCKYGYFGDGMCDYCRVRYQSHYERRTDE